MLVGDDDSDDSDDGDDGILPSAGPTDRRQKGYFCSLVMIGDDDSDDGDDYGDYDG